MLTARAATVARDGDDDDDDDDDDEMRPHSYIAVVYYVQQYSSSSVAVIYVLYVRLVNWTTRQRLHRLDRKNPDVSIGRSCFIGIRTETRNWPESTGPDCDDGGLLCKRTFHDNYALARFRNKTPVLLPSHTNQMSEKFRSLCFFPLLFSLSYFTNFLEKPDDYSWSQLLTFCLLYYSHSPQTIFTRN
ncbi:hypothetical protein QTP88_008492 [Uroleucon formosanum]